jgi:hypothetical protein
MSGFSPVCHGSPTSVERLKLTQSSKHPAKAVMGKSSDGSGGDLA